MLSVPTQDTTAHYNEKCFYCWCLFFPVRGCSDLQSPTYGRLVITGRVVGSVAAYACSREYRLVGEHIHRTCQESLQWSGSEPHCEAETGQVMIIFHYIIMTSHPPPCTNVHTAVGHVITLSDPTCAKGVLSFVSL